MDYKLLQLASGTKYPIGAYLFVQRGLDFTVRRIHGQAKADAANQAKARSRHITGDQLCYGLRDYALKQYGSLARTVLSRWSICSSDDFGHIVFALVDAGFMAKTDDDNLCDFQDVFRFNEMFTHELSLSAKH